MRQQSIALRYVTREDVARLKSWLEDDEVAESWFGRYSYGDSAHLGYNPAEVIEAGEDEWASTFGDPAHSILSIYTKEEHIGEFHVAIEEAWGDGQISILIGRKDLWHKGYGTATMRAGLDLCFGQLGLYRVWVDVPEYNTWARRMFDRLGFKHEGTLRKSRPHEGARFDSVVMGMLSTEYGAEERQDSDEV
ncbi:MAG: GNAT family N-acetyltransferase [Dehalococcoidia bacterium]|nr:GNAT family N-acetyltransferase [Dehalococcoidia bacterium]